MAPHDPTPTLADPLHETLDAMGAGFLRFGEGDTAVEVASDFGRFEPEYAAIHRYVGILHLPHRAVLRLTGEDRRDFLHRLITQDINAMAPGGSRRSFLLNDKGCIVADAIVHHGHTETWLELDRFDRDAAHALLDAKLFADDVTIEPLDPPHTLIALQGPASGALLRALAAPTDGDRVDALANATGTHDVFELPLAQSDGPQCDGRGDGDGDGDGDGNVDRDTEGRTPARVIAYRWDDAAVPGLRLWVSHEQAAALHAALCAAAGFDPDREAEPDAEYAQRRRDSLRGRPIGWHAYNTARIEAGTPLFHIDFGPDSLPAETGPAAFAQAVSMTKGCYQGQEIVARMHNLGHPKRVVAPFVADLPGRSRGDGEPSGGGHGQGADEDTPQANALPPVPLAGSPVFAMPVDPAIGAAGDAFDATASPEKADVAALIEASGGQPIGAVTSSCVAPLRGQQALGLAMMKWGHHDPGTRIVMVADGKPITGTIGEAHQGPGPR